MNVKSTTNYDIFSFLDGNRNISRLHVEKLKKSFAKKQLITPLLVNERMQIIDGQHRFVVESELNLPVYYIIVPNYGLEECHALNATSKKYSPEDFLEGYAKLGKESYIKFKEFRQQYPFLSMHLCQMYLTGGIRKDKQDAFKNGNFEISDYDKACQWADMAKDFKDYSGKFFGNRNFHTALLRLFKHGDYSHKRMMQKMETRGSELRHSAKEKYFVEDLCFIYNSSTREAERIHPYQLIKL
jgi:hypothetical protein